MKKLVFIARQEITKADGSYPWRLCNDEELSALDGIAYFSRNTIANTIDEVDISKMEEMEEKFLLLNPKWRNYVVHYEPILV